MNAHALVGSVVAKLNVANGLPNEHYVDPGVFAEEKRSVLFANWSGIGFGKDVPEAGDARPVGFLGMPLLIVRDRDGSIGVFQNTCRHRGMILVAEAAGAEAIIAALKLQIEKLRRELYGQRSERKARLLDHLELRLRGQVNDLVPRPGLAHSLANGSCSASSLPCQKRR